MRSAQVLGIAGTVLAGIPIAAPLVLLLISLLTGRGARLDFLLPGELIVAVVLGGLCLLAAALLSQGLRVIVGTTLGVVVALFALVGVTADATGLASGATQPEGWPLVVVGTVYGLYVLAVIGQFAVGVMLCRRLFAGERHRR